MPFILHGHVEVFFTIPGPGRRYSYFTFIERWALPIELRYSDFPIAIGLRKSNRNIGLAKLSDFKYWASNTGSPIV